MNEETIIKLKQAGVDIDGALERFMGNTEMYMKFLKKFEKDRNFVLLRAAMDEDDAEAAFSASHTLKGLTGNLSVMKLHGLFSKQVEFLRSNDFDSAKKMMPEIENEYRVLVSLVENIVL